MTREKLFHTSGPDVAFFAVWSLLLTTEPAAAQAARVPPQCYGKTSRGETYVLQYGPAELGGPNVWLCTAVAMPPAVPPQPTTCITAQWDGASWKCVDTNYLVPQ